jgi:hypothetical protein
MNIFYYYTSTVEVLFHQKCWSLETLIEIVSTAILKLTLKKLFQKSAVNFSWRCSRSRLKSSTIFSGSRHRRTQIGSRALRGSRKSTCAHPANKAVWAPVGIYVGNLGWDSPAGSKMGAGWAVRVRRSPSRTNMG